MTTLQNHIIRFALFLLMAAALPAAASGPVPQQETEPARGPVQDPSVALSTKPVVYENEGGDFRVVFPGGCGKLVTRFNEPDLYGGEDWEDIIQVAHVYCDRYQEEGEGCSVTATFNLHGEDGSVAGPAEVVRRIESALQGFGAKIVSQQAINKDFGNGTVAEGVEVRARPEESPAEVWIRGLLIDGDIYILMAWNRQGPVWQKPEYIAFFNSFQPWTD